MVDFKITNRDLTEILLDAKKFLNLLRYDKDLDKKWNYIRNMDKTLDYILSRKDEWETPSDDKLINDLTDTSRVLKESIVLALKLSISSDKLKSIDDMYTKNASNEKQNQNIKENLLIRQHWVPRYDNRIYLIEYLNHYYDSEGFLIEIMTDGTKIKRDIRLAKLDTNQR